MDTWTAVVACVATVTTGYVVLSVVKRGGWVKIKATRQELEVNARGQEGGSEPAHVVRSTARVERIEAQKSVRVALEGDGDAVASDVRSGGRVDAIVRSTDTRPKV